MKKTIKNIIKSNKFLFKLAEFCLWLLGRSVTHGKTRLNILKTFSMYEAGGWGLYPIRAELTVQSVNQTIPALSKFSAQSERNKAFEELLLKVIASVDSDSDERLSELFKTYGSDKSTVHNYYKIYSFLLQELGEHKKIFEIGLGTNNTDVVSTMGKDGKPGASLRAFRDATSKAQIFGADFDTRILFSEERIESYFVDQTNPKTFDELSIKIGSDFDLMIDDGLHSPNANLHSLFFFLQNIRVGGYAVVEDINILTKPIWEIVSQLIEPNYSSAFIQTKSACMFIVMREK
jgi:hypothetical protein